MPSLSILPLDYDPDFIIARAGLINHYGYEIEDDGIHLVYPVEKYDTVQAVIEEYPTAYLEVARPRRLDKVTELRKAKQVDFKFNGMPMVLDEIAQTNIVGAALGLMRNEEVQGVNWQVATHEFAFLPRDFVLGMADAAFLHVQACFSNAKALFEALKAATNMDELDEIDIDAGWPE